MKELITKITKLATVNVDKFNSQIVYLKNNMNEREQVIFCCQGYVKNKLKSFDKNCFIVCTDRRLFFLDKKFDKRLPFYIYLNDIDKLLLKRGISLSKIIIFECLNVDKTILYNLDKKHALAFEIFVNELIAKKKSDINSILNNTPIEKNVALIQSTNLNEKIFSGVANEKSPHLQKTTIVDSNSNTVSHKIDECDNTKYGYLGIYVAGSSFYQKEIKELLKNHCYYERYNGYTNSDIKENGDGYIEWEIPSDTCNHCNVEFIEEPDNEFDKNAIKVLIENIHVGYIPKKYIKRFKNISNDIILTTLEIHGGKYKEVEYDYDSDKNMISTNSKNLSFEIYVKYKIQ